MKMSMREQRGIVIAATCKLIEVDTDQWLVPSQSKSGKTYKVDYKDSSCNCPDNDKGRKYNKCKHLWAVEYTIKREMGRAMPAPEIDGVPLGQKPTYKQDWPAYNLAQTTEKHRYLRLLYDLSKIVPPFSRKPGAGRNSVPASNAVFAIAFKVYSGVSTRRFSCDLMDAYAKGYISQPIHYNSVCAYMEHPELTPMLYTLIDVSSRPLKQVETEFAADSTGFGTARFRRWFDEKDNVNRSGHDWVNAHIMCGVKTNIVTAVKIERRPAQDAPTFKHLLNATAKNFTIGEVSADKAYLAAEIFDAIVDAGGQPFIPFKLNSTGEVGGNFQKAFHYYGLHRLKYMEHYHKRSNVESTFSAIKRKFGWYVRSRTDTAMANEVLCKILCYNITCLVHSQCELGIESDFWGENNLPGKEKPS